MAKLPPVRKRASYSDIRSDDLVFALFYDRVLGSQGAMRDDWAFDSIATKTLNTLRIGFKHGKHDQRSHGRRTARRAAAQSTYQAARAGGASVADARTAAREVSDIYRRNQRIANIDRALEATRGMSQGQRSSLEAERARLYNEANNAYWARIPAAARQAPGVDEQINAAVNLRPEARTRGPADARLRDFEGRLAASTRERDTLNTRLRVQQEQVAQWQNRLANDPTLTPGGRKGLEKELARDQRELRAIQRDIKANDKLLAQNQREVDGERARGASKMPPPVNANRPSDQAYRAARAYEDKIRPQRFESALVLDGNGKVLIDKNGGKDYVTFSDADVAKARAARNVVMTHNHPLGWDVDASDPRRNGNSFSGADIQFAANAGVYEMRAVTPTGRYYVRRPPEGWDQRTWDNEIKPRYDRVNQQTRAEFTRRIRERTMTPEQAEARHTHTVWSQVFGDLGYEYGYEEG